MFNSSINVNDTNAKLMLNGFLNKLLDLSYENKLASDIASKEIQRHFNDEESPIGKWRPSIRVKKFGGKTLTKSGDLRNSLKLAQAITIDKLGFTFSSTLPYSAIHNNGGKFRHWRSGKFVHMPKRQYAWLSEQAKQQIINVYIKGFDNVTS